MNCCRVSLNHSHNVLNFFIVSVLSSRTQAVAKRSNFILKKYMFLRYKVHNTFKVNHFCTLYKGSQKLHTMLFGWGGGGRIKFPPFLFINALLFWPNRDVGEVLMSHTSSLSSWCWLWLFSEPRSKVPGLALPLYSAPGAPPDGGKTKTRAGELDCC